MFITKDSGKRVDFDTIEEFPEYEVNKIGQVRRKGQEYPLCQKTHKQGYKEVCIYSCISGDYKRYTRLVHRLVGLTFLYQSSGKIEINHKNGLKSDNRIENLEWVTPSENNRHSRALGLNSKLDAHKIKEIRRLRQDTNLTQKEIGEIFDVKPNTINQVLNKKRWGWLI